MKWKLWLNIATFSALALIIFFAWHDIVSAFERMGQLNIWVLLLLIPIQIFAYVALARMFYHFFCATYTKLPMKTLVPAMFELNFVNHVFPSGGVSGFSYLTIRLKPDGVSTAKSTLAQLARFAFTFMCFIVLLLIALFVLALEGRASSLVILVVSGVTFTMVFGTAVLIFVISRESRITAFTKGLARALNKCMHFLGSQHPEVIKLRRVEKTFLELHQDYALLKKDIKKMRRVLLWAFIMNIAELMVLYIVFVAHDVWPNVGAVAIAYAIANIAGLIAILPGGVGVYEPLMTAVFISTGIPAGVALSVTLVYRVVTLLLSLLTGYFLYQKVIHKYGTASFQRKSAD